MKTNIKNLFLLAVLSAGLGLTSAGRVTAQTFTILHSFTATLSTGPPKYSYTNSDGASPNDLGGLIITNDTLYGTAAGGGSSGVGTVFAVNINGTGFTNLHSFGSYPTAGAYPTAGLVLSGNTLYGTAGSSGTGDGGTVFAININGTGFTNLHSFTGYPSYDSSAITNSDGAYPGGLILSGNTLYGTAGGGGSS